jgi:hypothetical protein
VEGAVVGLVSVVEPLAGARDGRFVVDREWTEVGGLGMTLWGGGGLDVWLMIGRSEAVVPPQVRE